MFNRVSGYFIVAVMFVTLVVQAQYSLDDMTDPRGLNGGRTTATFLTLPVSAQQLGTGITASLGAGDATDIYFAPANTAFLNRYSFAMTHLEWLLGLRKEFTGACFPINEIGTLGLFTQVYTLGRFENARDINEDPSNPRALEFAAGASFARAFLQKRLSAGITASYIESRLAGEAGRAFGAGIEAMAQPLPSLSCRFFVRNLGTPIRYNELNESLPLQTGFTVRFNHLFHRDSLGNSPFSITTSLGCLKTIDEPIQFGLGAQAKLFSHVALRAGYEYTYGRQPALAGLAAGCGLDIKRYGMDVGWKYQSPDFGSVWSVTVRIAADEIEALSALDYAILAERYFNRNKLRMCIMYARKALAINPTLWQAHSLMTRTLEKLRRRQGLEIAIIYTANAGGSFIPRIVDETTIGGLARQATVINQLRLDYPLNLTIEGGSMITGTTDPLKAAFAKSYLDDIRFDAVGVGVGEVDFGWDRYCALQGKPTVKHLCTNGGAQPPSDIITSSTITRGGYTFAILDVVNPAGVKPRDSTFVPGAIAESLLEELSAADVQRADLRICIVHDTWSAMQALAARFPQIDIMLCASLDQPLPTPVTVGSTRLIAPGADGRYVGALSLRFGPDKKLADAENRLYALNDNIKPDAEIERAAQRISTVVDMQEQGVESPAVDTGSLDGVFLFVSTRRGTANIYLKSISRYLEYPLTTGSQRCSQPRLSAALGSALFIQESDSAHQALLKITDLTGTRTRTLPLPGSVREACFSPDDRWIYAVTQNGQDTTTDIYRIKPAGGAAVPVIAWERSSEKSIGMTPDGKKIVFISDKSGTWQIYMADTSGAMPLLLTKAKANQIMPRMNANGRYLAYLSDQYSFGGRMNLMAADMLTGTVARITRNTDIDDYAWLPDGETLLYSGGVNISDYNLRNIFRRETGKLIAGNGRKNFSETSAQIITLNEKPRVIYVREYVSGEKQVYLVAPDNGRDQQIINSDAEDWIE
jgi:hypothetical protein